jgi:hypothetical protein
MFCIDSFYSPNILHLRLVESLDVEPTLIQSAGCVW